jgi:hypothetical protein
MKIFKKNGACRLGTAIERCSRLMSLPLALSVNRLSRIRGWFFDLMGQDISAQTMFDGLPRIPFSVGWLLEGFDQPDIVAQGNSATTCCTDALSFFSELRSKSTSLTAEVLMVKVSSREKRTALEKLDV